MLGTLLVLVVCFVLASAIRIFECFFFRRTASDQELIIRAEEFVEQTFSLGQYDSDVHRALQISKGLSSVSSEARFILHNLQVLREHVGNIRAERPELGGALTAMAKVIQDMDEGTQQAVTKVVGFEEPCMQLVHHIADLKLKRGSGTFHK